MQIAFEKLRASQEYLQPHLLSAKEIADLSVATNEFNQGGTCWSILVMNEVESPLMSTFFVKVSQCCAGGACRIGL